MVVEPSPVRGLAADCLIHYIFLAFTFGLLSSLRCSNSDSKGFPAVQWVVFYTLLRRHALRLHASDIARLHIAIDIVREVRRTVLRGHFKQ